MRNLKNLETIVNVGMQYINRWKLNESIEGMKIGRKYKLH